MRPWRIVSLASLVLLAACSKPLSVEQQIVNTIEQMESHVEAGESRAFIQYVHSDFRGQGGSLNRDQARSLVLLYFKRYQEIEARLFTIDVDDLGGNQALAKFRALVTGGVNWLPESGQMYAFETRWQLDGDDWLLLEANWRPIAIDEVF